MLLLTFYICSWIGSKAARSHQNSVELGSDWAQLVNFVSASLGIALPRTGTVCQPEASACMLWGSHMNNNHGYDMVSIMVSKIHYILPSMLFI